ncbi:hypothetical protein DXB14_12675 [Parabacteroides distasonis]|nr:hypothetical protein DXB14_12675 [Parabacteroides distasonis]
MPKSVSTRSAYKMLTCIYLCRTLLFFAPYADFLCKKRYLLLGGCLQSKTTTMWMKSSFSIQYNIL